MPREHAGAKSPPTQPATVPRNRPRTRRLTASILISMSAFILTACTGDPAPVGSPPNGSPVASPSATPVPEPIRPVEEATPESAIQFTRYFWELYNYAYQTYDTAPLKAISDPQCRYCASTIADIKRIADAKTRIEDHEVTLREAASPPERITTGTVVVATSDQRPGRAVSPSGQAIGLKGSKGKRFTFALTWHAGQWQIEGIDYDTKSGKPWEG